MSLLLAVALAAAQQPEPGGVEQADQTELLNFSYVWPDAAERDPALVALLRARMETARERALADARESQRDARANGHELRPYYFTQSWRLAGDSGGLLSLTAVVETFAGGGPPDGRFESLLWDSTEHRPVPIAELLGPMLPGLDQRYCASLAEEWANVRGEPVRSGPEGSFALCPPLAEQVLALEDIDGNGRFDRLLVSIEPHMVAPDDDDPYTPEVDLEAAAPTWRRSPTAIAAPSSRSTTGRRRSPTNRPQPQCLGRGTGSLPLRVRTTPSARIYF